MGDADTAFALALGAGDKVTLAAEIRRRLDAATYGTSIGFRADRDRPCVWRGTALGEGAVEHVTMALEAARALIAVR